MFSPEFQLRLVQEHKAEIDKAVDELSASAVRAKQTSTSTRMPLQMQAWAPLPATASGPSTTGACVTGLDPVDLQVRVLGVPSDNCSVTSSRMQVVELLNRACEKLSAKPKEDARSRRNRGYVLLMT